jgi:hypothetical protein
MAVTKNLSPPSGFHRRPDEVGPGPGLCTELAPVQKFCVASSSIRVCAVATVTLRCIEMRDGGHDFCPTGGSA